MSKPIVVKKDGAVVKIYEVSAGKGYSTYQLAYYQGGQRKRETITKKADAIKRANDVVTNLSNGVASLNSLPTSTAQMACSFRSRRTIRTTISPTPTADLLLAARIPSAVCP